MNRVSRQGAGVSGGSSHPRGCEVVSFRKLHLRRGLHVVSLIRHEFMDSTVFVFFTCFDWTLHSAFGGWKHLTGLTWLRLFND